MFQFSGSTKKTMSPSEGSHKDSFGKNRDRRINFRVPVDEVFNAAIFGGGGIAPNLIAVKKKGFPDEPPPTPKRKNRHGRSDGCHP
jgi:hypothetical protein